MRKVYAIFLQHIQECWLVRSVQHACSAFYFLHLSTKLQGSLLRLLDARLRRTQCLMDVSYPRPGRILQDHTNGLAEDGLGTPYFHSLTRTYAQGFKNNLKIWTLTQDKDETVCHKTHPGCHEYIRIRPPPREFVLNLLQINVSCHTPRGQAALCAAGHYFSAPSASHHTLWGSHWPYRWSPWSLDHHPNQQRTHPPSLPCWAYLLSHIWQWEKIRCHPDIWLSPPIMIALKLTVFRFEDAGTLNTSRKIGKKSQHDFRKYLICCLPLWSDRPYNFCVNVQTQNNRCHTQKAQAACDIWPAKESEQRNGVS